MFVLAEFFFCNWLINSEENIEFYNVKILGKGADLAKADLPKPSKAGRQERKALRDVSNTALRDVSNIGKQPPLSSASKGTISKEKSTLRTRETPKNATKNNLLSDEEIKRCHEWAKEGIEQIHFTGNDLQKLQQDKKEQSNCSFHNSIIDCMFINSSRFVMFN